MLHDTAKDGTRIYTQYEAQLGMKASHGCIRIQRRANAQGQNMQWLWNNLENKTKVLIWDDQGRQMYEPELPDSNLQLYRNPNGGSNYHVDENCPGVNPQYLPLTGDFTYGDLEKDEFKKLTPCSSCGAPVRPETLYERYVFEAEQIGAEVTDEVKRNLELNNVSPSRSRAESRSALFLYPNAKMKLKIKKILLKCYKIKN